MRTREYVEKGESEGKSLVDAMRDSALDGMQHFDGVVEKLIREGVVDVETGLAYATNPGNLRLELADLLGDAGTAAAEKKDAPPAKASGGSDLEIERF